MPLTIDDVLRDLPRAPATVKIASALGDGPVTYGAMARKLAELVRAVPDPEVSWASLYAVKEAGYRASLRAPVTEIEVDESQPGAQLRKLAHTIRQQDNLRAVQLFQKSASALKAVRGLTLLRERTSR
jgi:hypothetical protein